MQLFVLWGILGCGTPAGSVPGPRILEMRDHEIDAFEALRAHAAGDLSALRRAGERLARPDEVPGLPVAATPMLEATRALGRSLANAPTVADAAPHLASLAGSCGACHEAFGVSPEGPERAHPHEQAFFAIALRDEARWQRVAPSLAPHGGEGAGGWLARQIVLASALAEGT